MGIFKRKKIKEKIIEAGDVFYVPLGENRYGYIKAYESGDFAIFDIISDKLLSLEVLKNIKIQNEASILTDKIDSGEWGKIGNIPFAKVEDKWPKPRKQEAPYWNPNVRYIIYKGKYIPDHIFGAYDELPPYLQKDPEDTIKYILENCTFEYVKNS